jgi:uroporphyrinogen decarboxylase
MVAGTKRLRQTRRTGVNIYRQESSAQTKMTTRERMNAALRGLPMDRPAISLWHHFPERDRTAADLTEVTVEFQRQLNLDFVKLMPTGMYSVMDYGVDVRVADDASGTTRFVAGPISKPADWASLCPVHPERGMLGIMLDAVRRIRAALGPEVPLLQTIFSPLTMATKMVEKWMDPSADDETWLRQGLAQLAEDAVAFGRACLDAGADGFFYATQNATRVGAARETYARFGEPYDRMVLERLRTPGSHTIMHLHGADPLFELAETMPVDGVSWHDRDTEPSLEAALTLTQRGLVGGISRGGVIVTGSPRQAATHAREALVSTGGRRHILAPGCVIPTTAPLENLIAVRQVVESSDEPPGEK